MRDRQLGGGVADPSERTFGRRRVRLRVSFEGIIPCAFRYVKISMRTKIVHCNIFIRGMSLLHIIA